MYETVKEHRNLKTRSLIELWGKVPKVFILGYNFTTRGQSSPLVAKFRNWLLTLRDFFTHQGCQMVYFQTKNPNLGNFLRTWDWKMLIYFMSICNILWTLGKFYDHLVHFVLIWYIFPVLVSRTKKNISTPLRTGLPKHVIQPKLPQR
jgi:hypothetical protein